MRYHAKIFTSYFEYIDPHPEDPRRIYRIYKILAENGLIDDPTLSGVDSIGDLMLKIPVREATDEEILRFLPLAVLGCSQFNIARFYFTV